MKTNSWKLSALVSALILTGINVHADEEYETEVREPLIKNYGDNQDKEDREDKEDEEDEENEDEDEENEDEDEENEDEDEDGEDEDGENGENSPSEIVLPTLYTPDAGRLLGSQCAQCHGTNGISTNSWDSIAGEGDLEDEIYDDEPIMTAQAHGYTSEEIILIGNWLKTLKNND